MFTGLERNILKFVFKVIRLLGWEVILYGVLLF